MKILTLTKINCTPDRFKFLLNRYFYLSFIVFIALLFSVNRGIATKEFYIVTFFFIISLRYNLIFYKNLKLNNVYLLSVYLILYSVISSIIFGSVDFDNIKSGFRIIVFLTIILFFLNGKKEIFTLFKIILAATVIGSGYDLFNFFFSGSYQKSLPFGIDTKFLWHIYAGGVYSIVAMISAHLAVMGSSRIEKMLYSLSCVYLSALVYLSQSRAAILCYLLSIVIYLLLNKRVKIKYGVITLLAFSLIAGVVNSHIYEFTSLLERKDAGRFEIWHNSLAILKNKILFGHGLGADFFLKYGSGAVTEPHNLYLYAIFTGGLVCLFILLILYWMAMKAVLDHWCPDLGPLMASLLLFIMTFNFFDSRKVVDDIGVSWPLFWFPIGLIAAFASLRTRAKVEPAANNPA